MQEAVAVILAFAYGAIFGPLALPLLYVGSTAALIVLALLTVR